MKPLFYLILTIHFAIGGYCQKPPVDTSDFDTWPMVATPSLSNDGKFATYQVLHQPRSSSSFVIRSIRTKWKYILKGIYGVFTPDSRFVVFRNEGDSLGILMLGRDSIEYINGVAAYRIPQTGNGSWIAYDMIGDKKKLIIRNLITRQERTFLHVTDYQFSPDGKYLALVCNIGGKGNDTISLTCMTPDGRDSRVIWEGERLDNLVFDGNTKQLVFVGMDEKTGSARALYRYTLGKSRAVAIGAGVEHIVRFNHSGTGLFVTMATHDTVPPAGASTGVIVWSYLDSRLPSQVRQANKENQYRSYTYFVSFQTGKFIRLERSNDYIKEDPGNRDDESVLVVEQGKGDLDNEWNWNREALCSVYLVSTTRGERKLIAKDIPHVTCHDFHLSPSGKYVVYYNPKAKDYFSYNTATGEVRNISKGVMGEWTSYYRKDQPNGPYLCLGIAGWLDKDDRILVYDQTDIFELDPNGQELPFNVTGGDGRKNDIEFRLAIDHSSGLMYEGERLLLNAFNRKTKDNGFYRLILGRGKKPELLSMQPFYIEGTAGSSEFDVFPPLKASEANVYLVRKMSASSSPNYFSTEDFIHYNPVSDVYPEQSFNWIRSELVTWKLPDGSTTQGILYKPEDFDRRKKYPVIFHLYERFSEGLNGYIEPGFCTGPMNIPYFVSNGYLVFAPDIHYVIGQPGRSAYNTVVSAAAYLGSMPFVDTARMGLQGHSFGGFETNYIISHARMFAAAMSSSGMSDFISCYGSIIGDGTSRQRQYELFRDRIGVTPWDSLDLYLKNSPVLYADKIVTPLLLMANPLDGDVPYGQGVELFTALRRLGRRCWMLQYDDGGHLVFDKNADDLTCRMKQFFDHYLMGKPIPAWML